MVIKIDTQEAFDPIVKLRNSIILIAIIVLVLGVLAASLVARSISEPIRRLRQGAELIGSGDLDHKVGIETNDEIGQLRNTIVALRDELDRRKIEAEQKCRAVEQAARDEAKQLHGMIRELRDRLEEYAQGKS